MTTNTRLIDAIAGLRHPAPAEGPARGAASKKSPARA